MDRERGEEKERSISHPFSLGCDSDEEVKGNPLGFSILFFFFGLYGEVLEGYILVATS